MTEFMIPIFHESFNHRFMLTTFSTYLIKCLPELQCSINHYTNSKFNLLFDI